MNFVQRVFRNGTPFSRQTLNDFPYKHYLLSFFIY